MTQAENDNLDFRIRKLEAVSDGMVTIFSKWETVMRDLYQRVEALEADNKPWQSITLGEIVGVST